MKIKQKIEIVLFTIILTIVVLLFQWTEFYKGYSYDVYNFWYSVFFLIGWLLFSFYWGGITEKKYLKFICLYWGVSIFLNIVMYVFINNKLIQSFLFPFYTWYDGPIYGMIYGLPLSVKASVNIKNIILIMSPLCFAFSVIGYYLGNLRSRLRN